MTKALAVAILTLAVAGGCGQGRGPGGAGAGTPAELPVGATYLSTSVTEGGQARPLVAGTRISISFTEDGLRAYAGCNHLMAEVRLDGDRLQVATLGGTEMACDEDLTAQDEWLTGFLADDPTWRLDGDELTLTSGETEIRLLDKEVAVPDQKLTGTRWTLDTLIEGETASSLPSGVTAWITFGSDGLAVGNAGCNDFGGSGHNYRADATTITFTDVISTQMSCGDVADGVERTVLGILNGRVRYEIDGDVLTLTQPSGAALRFRAG